MRSIPKWFVILIFTALDCTAAHADLILRVGDSVYVGGKTYTKEEWQKVKELRATRSAVQAEPEPIATAQPEGGHSNAKPLELRAASCKTTRAYEEFPSDSELFACSGGIGNLTREDMLRAGWRVDLIEKLTVPNGETATSSRGVPLSYYKLILSR